MNRVTLILTFFLSLMFSSSSYSEWTKVDENVSGSTFYVDFDRIRKHGGYVYWWDLGDYLKPINGILSAKIYTQGDCKLLRFKVLSVSLHEEPMGGGTGDITNPKNPEWMYPPPNSVIETALKSVCNR